MWNLSFPNREQTHVPCIGRWILSHWTTRKVLDCTFFLKRSLTSSDSPHWASLTAHLPRYSQSFLTWALCPDITALSYYTLSLLRNPKCFYFPHKVLPILPHCHELDSLNAAGSPVCSDSMFFLSSSIHGCPNTPFSIDPVVCITSVMLCFSKGLSHHCTCVSVPK